MLLSFNFSLKFRLLIEVFIKEFVLPLLMTDKKFFDESILSEEIKNSPYLQHLSSLEYHLKRQDIGFVFSVQIGTDRLSGLDIKALLKSHQQKSLFSESDLALLTYIAHKLGDIQSIYKVFLDIDLVLSYAQNGKYPLIYDGKKVVFSKKPFMFAFALSLEQDSSISLSVSSVGEFIFGSSTGFYYQIPTLFTLSTQLPLKFYKEIEKGKTSFSIESFLSLKQTLLEKLKKEHNVTISPEVQELADLSLEEKIAPTVLEVEKTNHFVILNLKYKVGSDYYPIENYKYLETSSWVDKSPLIKIVKEEGKLIKYISNLDISESTFEEMFRGTFIKLSASKTPFTLMLPLVYLDKISKVVLPRAQETFEIVYKGGKNLEVVKENIEFEVETNLHSRINLFEFKIRFKVHSQYFDLEFFKQMLAESKKYIQLTDGTTVHIENLKELNRWIEFLSNFEFKRSQNVYKTDSKAALELDEFLKKFEHKKVLGNDEYKNLLMEMKDRKPILPIIIPEHVNHLLRDYQKEGVYWLHFLQKYQFGGILADEMGLGKTIQALTILAMNPTKKHMVVCPKTLMYNWENEAKQFFPNLKVLVLDGDSDKRKRLLEDSKDYHVLITSYSMLQKDYMSYVELNLEFEYMILDEAHYVKNMKTLSAKAVRVVRAERKVLLTGTPLENNLDELYSAFDLIMPEYLGNKSFYRRDFVSKIERNNQVALELLQAKIRPFILRRTKQQVLKELPDKQEQTVFSEMTNKQALLYNEVLSRVRNEVNELVAKQGFDKSRMQVLSALLKLRQICNHPSLVDKAFENDEDISGKYEQFLELLSEVVESGEKVLLFSQFTSMLDIFEKELNKQKIKYTRLDGSTKDRQEVVEQFQTNPDIKVFLISLKAGGVGLNLTAASVVFLYDPWWNPMVEKQAMDRAHRIGQEKTVNIYKFITKNSIEEKILKLQERKGNLFENLVTENAGFMKRLEWEDLMELFD